MMTQACTLTIEWDRDRQVEPEEKLIAVRNYGGVDGFILVKCLIRSSSS